MRTTMVYGGCGRILSVGFLLFQASAALSTAAAPVEAAAAIDARSIILAPQSGDGKVDQEIGQLQGKIRSAKDPNPFIVRLGWAFVAKARLTSDPGYYKLAEQCSQLAGEESDSLLLRGHIFHALHRFSEAESVARKLTSDPVPRWENYALLGDALMEQGKLSDAIGVYQRMIDIRPCLQTYARVAHVRWLKGDVIGAEELMKTAVSAGNSRDPEPGAWAYSRLAFYQLQSGNSAGASRSIARALEFVKDFPAALFLQGKIDIVNGAAEKAVQALTTAATQSPLPDYQWALADAARLSGNAELAAKTEAEILSHGAIEDPRSYALFLANRNEKPELALQFAQDELTNRRDVFTYDALAWAELAAGNKSEAKQNMQRALAEGTADARLFYHAGKIAAAFGDNAQARKWFTRAVAIQQMLLPSERADLTQQVATLSSSRSATAKLSSTNPPAAKKAVTRK
ncbi:MAG: tetratricopeptide repeat protein [Spartobacteria bacterium]